MKRTGTLMRIQNIERTLLQIEGVVGKLRRQILELDQHYHNRIAAHKAHHTMKKRKLADKSDKRKNS